MNVDPEAGCDVKVGLKPQSHERGRARTKRAATSESVVGRRTKLCNATNANQRKPVFYVIAPPRRRLVCQQFARLCENYLSGLKEELVEWKTQVFFKNMKNKLLWLLVAVIAFDFGITIFGQPASYWHHPQTADEGNPVFRWFMFQGAFCYLGFILTYIAGVLALVTCLPKQAVIITGLVFLLSHYFAGSTWLSFHFHLGMAGPIIYAVVLSVALILILQSGGLTVCRGTTNRAEK